MTQGERSWDPAEPPVLRYDRRQQHLVLGTEDDQVIIRHDGSSAWVARLEDVGLLKAAALQRVLRRANEDTEGDDAFEVVEGQDPDFDEEYVQGDVRFDLTLARLGMQLVAQADGLPEDGADLRARLRQTARPILERGRAELTSAKLLDTSPPGLLCEVTIVPSIRGHTIGSLYRLGVDVIRVLDAASSGSLTMWSVQHLLLAGQGDLLIGQPEGSWLDAKGQDYNLDTDTGKISLAQDVARFANAEAGGVLAIGLRTKKFPGGDVISSISPVPEPKSGTRRHRQAIDTRVYPPPDGLTVQKVSIAGGP